MQKKKMKKRISVKKYGKIKSIVIYYKKRRREKWEKN